MQRAKDAFGVFLADCCTPLQARSGLSGLLGAEDVAGGQIPVPSPQALQALLLFLELRQGELGDPDLLGDLLLKLAAIRKELRPVRRARGPSRDWARRLRR